MIRTMWEVVEGRELTIVQYPKSIQQELAIKLPARH